MIPLEDKLIPLSLRFVWEWKRHSMPS